MIYVPRNPAPPLGNCVETLFHLKGYRPEHAVERVVPDASINIIVELDGQRRWVADNETLEPIQYCQRSWVSGTHRRYFSISALADTELLAIRFRPGGFFPLLGRSVDEISDRVVDGVELLGASLGELREELLQLQSSEEKLDRTEAWLGRQIDFALQPPMEIQTAIQAIQNDPTLGALKDIVDNAGYSRKQFIHLFKKHIGLPPKAFQCILRFTEVLVRVQQQQPISWASLSADCGYFDQSHFIKDFCHFSGFNPSEFLQTETDRANFFPIDDVDAGAG